MSEKQRTIGSAIFFAGKGLHTGVNINMTIKPAAAGFGIKFSRVDMDGCPVIDALAEYVTETSRSTVIERHGARISTVEHVMAALWGCGVDNALVEVDGPEVPIGDGSSLFWVGAIEKVGIVELNVPRVYYTVRERVVYSDQERGVELVVYPDDEFSAEVNVNFDSRVIGHQYARFVQGDDFGGDIAPCRTFVFLHDILPLLRSGLIKGGDLSNAVVVVERAIDSEQVGEITRMLGVDVGDDIGVGYMMKLRFDNEIARHKLLDLLGDLALVGVRIKGRVVASRPGHKANSELAKLMRRAIKADALKPEFKYDPNAVPVYDINQIQGLLPHRPPFLLVDKVMYMDESKVVGIKQVTMNEPFFVGHFPGNPVMPGVLQVEAMAQCGGILALSSVDDPEAYSTYFMKIDNVKYRQMVVPGDTLMFVLELTEPIRRGIVQMRARAYVGDVLVTEASLMAMITKDKK